MHRRSFLQAAGTAAFAAVLPAAGQVRVPRPNILLAISDDQSWLHTGAAGDPVVKTPAFDRAAREGLLFTHAFCDAPSCGPSRSALLTGQHIWRLEEAGNIHSTLPSKFITYTELLAREGYAIGHTSKGWSPGHLEPGGRTENPAGPRYEDFAAFLAAHPVEEQIPFCFWLGSNDAHRPYDLGSGVASGKSPEAVVVPPHLPDHPVVRSDILDYYVEIERFDRTLAQAMALLEERGLLDNTLIVVTSDNGMPFPRAKASLYDYGTRMPLAIRWPAGIRAPGRTIDDFVSLSDLAPTFLEAAGIHPPECMTARSLQSVFSSDRAGRVDAARHRAFTAMERHDGCRKGGKGYPCRALRTKDFLYIRNYAPDRWPAGDPDASVCARAIPYGEVDSSPTKTLMMENADEAGFRRFHDLAFGMRPGEELYGLKDDPGQIRNVAAHPDYAEALATLREDLDRYTKETGDPRALGEDAPWDYYPYYGARINKDWTVDERPAGP